MGKRLGKIGVVNKKGNFMLKVRNSLIHNSKLTGMQIAQLIIEENQPLPFSPEEFEHLRKDLANFID